MSGKKPRQKRKSSNSIENVCDQPIFIEADFLACDVIVYIVSIIFVNVVLEKNLFTFWSFEKFKRVCLEYWNIVRLHKYTFYV